MAARTFEIVGAPIAGRAGFDNLYEWIGILRGHTPAISQADCEMKIRSAPVADEPDLLD